STGLSPSSALAFRDEDGAFAWQALAELRSAISENIDVGLKYRYFQTGKLNFGPFCRISCGTTPSFDLNGKFHSHSLMASLIYNFAGAVAPAPPPPPALPPPPPPPATQTCPDGSVILATSVCPPPPAPPPPPPPVERGERGE
ncbi:MAG: outer membrane protein, partial [Sphingomicrobium sp.]